MDVKVVCFDLDDTLCDETSSIQMARATLFNHIQSMHDDINVSLFQREYIEIWHEIDAHYMTSILQPGIGERELRLDHITRVLNACGIHHPAFAMELSNLFWEARRQALQLFSDSLFTLRSLREQYNLSLLTNGPSDYQRQKIDDLQIANYFDHIIIAGEVGYAKPDQAIFNILVAKYAIPASEILYVGNSQRRDIKGALGAGLKSVWINRSNATLHPQIPKPHYTVESLIELIDILS